MSKPLRLFFAIEINDEWRLKLAAFIKDARHERWGQQVRWAPIENLHMTLRFIGACNSQRLPQIIEQVTTAIKGNTPFSLQASAIHLFPSPSKPHVISQDFLPHAELFKLQQVLENAVIASGFPADQRAFLPHITLGRIGHHVKITLPEDTNLKLNSLLVREIVLMNSEQVDNKSEYTVLHRFTLA